jgi:hypothetical protein
MEGGCFRSSDRGGNLKGKVRVTVANAMENQNAHQMAIVTWPVTELNFDGTNKPVLVTTLLRELKTNSHFARIYQAKAPTIVAPAMAMKAERSGNCSKGLVPKALEVELELEVGVLVEDEREVLDELVLVLLVAKGLVSN